MLHCDTNWLVSGTDEREVLLWDLERMEVVGDLRGHFDRITGIEVTPDGKSIFTSSDDYTVRRWDTRSDGEILAARLEYEEVATRLRSHSDQDLRSLSQDAGHSSQ